MKEKMKNWLSYGGWDEDSVAIGVINVRKQHYDKIQNEWIVETWTGQWEKMDCHIYDKHGYGHRYI